MENEPLPVELPDEVLGLIVGRILHAGRIAQRSYSEQDKWDITAFGALLWRLSWNHVADALREAGEKVWFEENSLRFTIGGFTCALYAGGHSLGWDVHSYDFTRTRKRGEIVNEDQGQLFDPSTLDREIDVDPNELRSLTFVYCGDPQVGVTALYLGASIEQRGIVRWAWVRCLHRSDEGGGGASRDEINYPPFGDQPEPSVQVKPRPAVESMDDADDAR